MTIAQALRDGCMQLAAAGVPDSRLDGEYLLAHVLGTSRLELVLQSREALSPEALGEFQALLYRRAERIPLQYLVGSQDFMGRTFYVDERVLIPRPETEILCELALQWLSDAQIPSPGVLDLCTGSGALGISIALNAPKAQVTAADLSADALQVAQRNAEALQAKVTFAKGDFLDAVKGQVFDLIVCNPPYIPVSVCPTLQPEVLREPYMALCGGEDGLYFYKKLSREAPSFLRPGGALFCEVGDGQAEDVVNLFQPYFLKVEAFSDLSDILRVVHAQNPNPVYGGAHV